MKKYYWYCEKCNQRGSKLFDDKKDAERRKDTHNNKFLCNGAKIRTTKGRYLPFHVK